MLLNRREFLGVVYMLSFGAPRGKLLAESLDDETEFISREVFDKAREITIPNYRVHPIAIDGEERLEKNGNGFVLGDKYFTAHHIYEATSKRGDGRLVVNGRVLKCLGFDSFLDIALFQLPRGLENHMNDWEFNPGARLYEGQEIVVYGNPDGYFFRYAEGLFKKGQIKKIHPTFGENPGFVDYKALTVGGDSGSPVFDARTGNVLGVVVGVYEKEKGTSIGDAGAFIPIKKFSKFISED